VAAHHDGYRADGSLHHRGVALWRYQARERKPGGGSGTRAKRASDLARYLRSGVGRVEEADLEKADFFTLSETIASVKPWEWQYAPLDYLDFAYVWAQTKSELKNGPKQLTEAQAKAFAPYTREEAEAHLRAIGALK